MSQARPALDLAWLGCDLISGQIIEELADLRPTGPLRRLLGEDQSMQFTLPLPKLGSYGSPPPNWEAATEPGRTLLVAVLNGQPVWAGIILARQGGSSALITLGTVTCEGYLDRRYIGDHTWTQRDEASVIAAGLLKDAAVEGIGLVIDAPPTGRKRDREYFSKDNKTVKSAMSELAGVIDGIEWTVDLAWTDANQTAVRKVARVRKRIGVVAPDGGPVVVYGGSGAAAVFDSPGAADTRYELTQDYSDGRGANHIVAWSSGEGEDMPFGSPARDTELLASGMPRYEERFQPSTSIIDVATLDQHASERLALIGRGTTALTLTARADVYPRLGEDWRLGDEIGYELVGHWHRQGLVGQARAVGWELEPQLGTVTPILLTPPGGFAQPGAANWVENPSFEQDLAGWQAGGTVLPTLARTGVRAHKGGFSLLVTWNAGTPTNLLTAAQSTMETSITGWQQLSGWQTIAQSNDTAHGGGMCLAATMTAPAAGRIMAFNTLQGAAGVPITPGTTYVSAGWVRAASTGRSCRLRLAWYTPAGVYLPGEDDYGAYKADNASGWVQLSVTGVAPPTAGRVAVEVRIGTSTNEPTMGEKHYADDFQLYAQVGVFPLVQTDLDNLVPGEQYNAAAWVWVAADGRPVTLGVAGIGNGAPSSVEGTWQQITHSFTATSPDHTLQLVPVAPVLGGEQVYLDEVEVTAAG